MISPDPGRSQAVSPSPPRKHNARGLATSAVGLHLTLVAMGKHHTRGPRHTRLKLRITDPFHKSLSRW
nr:unnamed protein product [Digitaria exilis]